MFGNLGFSEMLLIFAVALIVFGPRRLPEIARSLGKTLATFRRAATDLRDTVEKEVGAGEIRRSVGEVRSAATLPGSLDRLAPPRAIAPVLPAPPSGPAAPAGAAADPADLDPAPASSARIDPTGGSIEPSGATDAIGLATPAPASHR